MSPWKYSKCMPSVRLAVKVMFCGTQYKNLFLFYRTLRPHSAETTTLNSFPEKSKASFVSFLVPKRFNSKLQSWRVSCRIICLTAASVRKEVREESRKVPWFWMLPYELSLGNLLNGEAEKIYHVRERMKCCKEQRSVLHMMKKPLVWVSRHQSRECW